MLFDFSLSRCSPENIRAGTPGYLDPFLPLRKPPAWDLQAERFSAAVTLYQMATGDLPVWHDGKTDPTMVECEATIDAERFDPNLREQLTDFFRRALRRNPKERFDNAQQMLEAWQKVFSTARHADRHVRRHRSRTTRPCWRPRPSTPTSRNSASAPPPWMPWTASTWSRCRICCTYGAGGLARMRGVGNKTRKRILAAVKVLRERLGSSHNGRDRSPFRPTTSTPTRARFPRNSSASTCLPQRILRAKAKSRNATETTALEALLGLDQRVDLIWPSQGDIAPLAGVTRGRISQILAEAQARWLKDPAITALRDQIASARAEWRRHVRRGTVRVPA